MIKKDQMSDINTSKVFCMAPWVHLHVWPNGQTYACCLHPPESDSNALGNIRRDGLQAVWNSPNIRKLRANMLAEKETPEVCVRCYEKSDAGMSDLRTWMNEKFYENHKDVVATTQDDGTVDKFNLVHWDFRFSNICNLRCRTCGPELSNQWYEDTIAEFPRLKNTLTKVERIVERNDPDFWALLESIVPQLETIHFAGGEPLIMEEHYKVLELLHKHQRYEVDLHYSTNFSLLKYKSIDLIDQWRHFNSVRLSLSIDGLGEHFNVLRKNAKWEDILTNFEYIKKANLPNLSWWVHYTVSALNVMHLPVLHKFLLENKYFSPLEEKDHFLSNFMINPIFTPEYYSFSAMTQSYKEAVLLELENHANYLRANYPSIQLDMYISLINNVRTTECNEENHRLFLARTKFADELRGENLLEAIPELRNNI